MKLVKAFRRFIRDGIWVATHGNTTYHIWMGILTLLMLAATYAYSIQIKEGLIVTGMNDRISWGLYISNFTLKVAGRPTKILVGP